MDTTQYHLTSQPPPPTKPGKMGLQALAEVAIGRLMEQEQQDEAEAMAANKTKIISRNYSLKQIRKLSEKKLLTTFAERLKRVVDKNQKLFSYKCQILPHLCQQSFECSTSAGEANLKSTMVAHLLGHLCNLEKSEPSIKISSRRTVVPRNRSNSNTTTKKSASSASATNRPPATAITMTAATPITLQQAIAVAAHQQPVLVANATPGQPGQHLTALDMSSTSSMVLKFLEEDHPYTMVSATAAASAVSASASTVAASSGLSGILSEALSSAGIISAPAEVVAYPSMISSPSAIEIRGTSSAASLQASPPPPPPILSNPGVSESSNPQNIRALALDYIDDIRKKSSSAAKSVIVNGDKSLVYQCKICPDKQFTSTNGLIFHYKKHAGLKPYVCELCASTFTRQHSLNYHMLIHLNKSRFVCTECGRHFRHPSHFKEHMRRHTGETPFQCGDCLIRFKTRNTYKRHLQTKHAKILTSKGIIELSAATAGGVYQPGGKTEEKGPASAAVAANVGAKARRKYPRYSKNTKQEVVSAAAAAPVSGPPTVVMSAAETAAFVQGQPLDYSQHHHHVHQNPNPNPNQPSNITIVQIPQLAGVHLLEHSGQMSPSARLQGAKLELGPESYVHVTEAGQHGHHHQPMTLISYQHPILEPIQPTSATAIGSLGSPPMHSSGQLTELTSSPALTTMLAAGSAATSHLHVPAEAEMEDASASKATTVPGPAAAPAPVTTTSNDNFNMLLAAIEMTEDGPKME